MSKQFWAIIVIIILVLIGIFAFTGNKSDTKSNTSTQPTQHVEGQGKAGVTLIEYGDYECPFCGQYYPTLKEVEQQYDSLIHFQFRNFPLTSLHPNAFAGARAAEAAGLQGKFWQMHDTLYENQDPSGKSGWVVSGDPLGQFFVNFAQEIGLDVTQFKDDFASDKVNSLVNADMAAGNKLNVNATPSFFLDGKQVQINNTVADFQKVLNAEITKKDPNATLPTAASSAPSPTESTSQTTQ